MSKRILNLISSLYFQELLLMVISATTATLPKRSIGAAGGDHFIARSLEHGVIVGVESTAPMHYLILIRGLMMANVSQFVLKIWLMNRRVRRIRQSTFIRRCFKTCVRLPHKMMVAVRHGLLTELRLRLGWTSTCSLFVLREL